MFLPTSQSALENSQRNHNIKRTLDNAAHGLYQVTRTLVERASSSSDDTTSSSTCKAEAAGGKCVTPASIQNTQNIAIVLGVVIPLTCAVTVLIFLHRRLRRKQKLEDKNDPHKSLDFGMDGIEPTISKGSKKTRKGPEMSVAEFDGRPSKRGQGLSMDLGMGIGSPYLLPAGLNGSHESIHSMSRSLRDEHDPYRPVAFANSGGMRPSTDNDSISRFGRLTDDKASLYSMSTGHHSSQPDRAGLLAHARPMSQSFGARADSMSPRSPLDVTSPGESPMRFMHSANPSIPPPIRKSSMDKALPDIVEKDLPLPIAMPEPAVSKELPPPPRTTSTVPSIVTPRGDSMLTASVMSMPSRPESSNYGDEEPPAPASAPVAAQPTFTFNEPPPDAPYDIDPAMIYTQHSDDMTLPPARVQSLAPKPKAGQRLSVMGVRPIPSDLPEDNPEVRANRIRSFYKEYFDDSKPNPAAGQYDEEDYYDGIIDGVIYDPDTGGFFAPGTKPWAQGPARRAMTPPPRSRPRVSGSSAGHYHGRINSTMSGGRPRGRSLPKKKLPPPKPLQSLPTPHMLKEDHLVFTPIDFAPPSSFRELQAGRRPDSPMGVSRPYSPAVRAFTPLASSFENLSALPSPHDLRKSGTFTALDFAPPSKIRDPMLSPSDAGSIRSGRSARSGISAMQSNAVRAGAYRVSRIPKDIVSTQDDMALQLKPRMNLTLPS